MSCGNSDILALIDYFQNGTDLSNNDWDNYNYYDLWNAIENGATPPNRTVCATFVQADIRSIVFAVLGVFTSPSDYLGENIDFYYLYLKAIGQEVVSPSFGNFCIGQLYNLFSIGLTAKFRQGQNFECTMSKVAAIASITFEQGQQLDALLSKSAALQNAVFEQQQTFSAELAGFDADYQSVLDYATAQGYTLPSSSQQSIQNQLMIDLKAAATNGLTSYHIINIWANDTGNNNFGSIQWQDQSTQSILNNSPTYNLNSGIQGDGVSAFYDTLYAPSSGSQNDVFFGVWYTNNLTDTTEGMTNGVRFHIRPRTTSNEIRSVGLNSSTGITSSTGGAITTSAGFSVIERTSSTAMALYKNGLSQATGSDTSITPTSLTICGLCRRTGAGATANHNTSNHSFMIIGKASEVNQSTLYAALNTYLTSI